ncbi:hypothetical protein V1512DRAFT_263512 [Lipomyces arxii]|uniref:uncharacterized protein n=1 Tax=Lipomyces arxii TaxID=56418 RepID=UPI0034CFCE4E
MDYVVQNSEGSEDEYDSVYGDSEFKVFINQSDDSESESNCSTSNQRSQRGIDEATADLRATTNKVNPVHDNSILSLNKENDLQAELVHTKAPFDIDNNIIYDHITGTEKSTMLPPQTPVLDSTHTSPVRIIAPDLANNTDFYNDPILFPPFEINSSAAETVMIASSVSNHVETDSTFAVVIAEVRHDKRKKKERKVSQNKKTAKTPKAKKNKPFEDDIMQIKPVSEHTEIQPQPVLAMHDTTNLVAQTVETDKSNEKLQRGEPDKLEAPTETTPTSKKENKTTDAPVKKLLGPGLIKQPAYRVGLSKRVRVDSLHAYLKR